MNKVEYKPSILLSIFKRNGGEGDLTKIITDNNKANFSNQIGLIQIDEIPWLCFKENENNWLLITSKRILEMRKNINVSISFFDLSEVTLAMQEEMNNNIHRKEDFTLLFLKERSGKIHILQCEKGKPFQGIYQVLHYISLNNK